MANLLPMRAIDPVWDRRFSEQLQKAPVSCRHLVGKGYTLETHHHLGVEFLYCQSGEGVFSVNGHLYPYKAPVLLHFEGKMPHSVTVHGTYERWNICIEPNALLKVIGTTEMIPSPSSFSVPSGIRMTEVSRANARRLEGVFADIAGELNQHEVHYEEIVSLRLKELSVLFDRFARETGLHVKPTKQTDELLDIRAHIEANLAEDVTAGTLADAFHYSEKHVYRLVRRLTGFSLGEYLKQRRIARACNLLEATNLAVTAIGDAVGIADPSQFSRTFRDVTGVSPSKYRLSKKKAE